MASRTLLPALSERLLRAASGGLRIVRAVAFWTGVLLPLSYVPLLVLVDAGRVTDLGLLTQLVAVNLVACVVGHGYDPRGRGP